MVYYPFCVAFNFTLKMCLRVNDTKKNTKHLNIPYHRRVKDIYKGFFYQNA